MSAQVFINNDFAFFEWCKNNPFGLFINAYKKPSIKYMVLHQVGCSDFKMLDEFTKNRYTGQYIKICSTDINDLMRFINAYGGTEFSKTCKHCSPPVAVDRSGSFKTQQEYDNILQLQLAIEKSNPTKTGKNTSIQPPEKLELTTYIYKRNPTVVIQALARANGHCENCHRPAPFQRISDGSPYLEIHHIKPLGNGGADIIDNVIAVCPNCHRYYHHGVTKG